MMRTYHWYWAGKILGAAGAIGLVMATASCRGPGGAGTKFREAPRLVVVQQGKALARIVIAADAPKPTQDAAVFLADYIQKSTTVRLDVVKEPVPADALIAIDCGATSYAKRLNLGVEKLDMDGFVIAFPGTNHIVLIGVSDTGQDYAVYEFLERYVGVRWLFPGKVGEYVPVRDSLAIPATEVREQPMFRHRLLSGLGMIPKTEKPENKGEQNLWAHRNRMHERVRFHHNLWRIFPPEQYGKTHPEFFPVLKGQRFVPQPAPGKTMEQDERAQAEWQPCFTAPGIVDEAVKNIGDYFAKNPPVTSYSFGVNDSGGHCECPACLAKDGGRTNVLGLRDASTGYYTWCNAVARGVNQKYPDKCFGLLAYSGVYSPPPGLQLDGHIVPFITYDRMKWVNPEIERKGHTATEEWEKSAPVLGWYDYIYGGLWYVAPRVYFHKMAEYLRYGYRHNVRHYYAEAYPSWDWHEGPKLYVLLKLLWNPDQDVDAILKDWYVCAVGPEAAPYLAGYFALWEEFWTKRAMNTTWFRKNGDLQYLDFTSSRYMDALTREDVVKCEELLTKAVQAATGEAERARAKYFLDGFMARKGDFENGLPFRPPAHPKVVDELLKSSFDKDINGWGNWQRDYSKAKFSFDPGIGHAAPGALKVEAEGSQASPLCFTNLIPIGKDKTYHAAVWFRADKLAPGGAVRLVIKWQDAKKQWVDMVEREALAEHPKTGEWHKLDVYFKKGSGGRWDSINTAVILLTTDQTDAGIVWFDDFTFEEIQSEP